jgi:hypothetical protein
MWPRARAAGKPPCFAFRTIEWEFFAHWLSKWALRWDSLSYEIRSPGSGWGPIELNRRVQR